MLWLTRPAIVRPLVAIMLVAAGVAVELRPRPTVLHPFAIEDLPAGSTIDDRSVTYRQIPDGMLMPVRLPIVADRAVRLGEPILEPGTIPTAPPDWWALDLPAPEAAGIGSPVRLVLTRSDTDPIGVTGLVIGRSDDGYGRPTALIAVPETWADLVGAAAEEDRVTVMVGR